MTRGIVTKYVTTSSKFDEGPLLLTCIPGSMGLSQNFGPFKLVAVTLPLKFLSPSVSK